jgi:Ca-activated chloride channel homolog
VLAGRPVQLFGKWRDLSAPGGAARETITPKLVIDARAADGPRRLEAVAREDRTSSMLRHLWARQRIATLGDQEALDGGQTQKPAITELGLRYGLLTSYTSFIAIDQQLRNSNPGQAPDVDQPLPLPEGVSPRAVGGPQPLVLGAQVPSTPEPATWAALCITLLALGAGLARRRRSQGYAGPLPSFLDPLEGPDAKRQVWGRS